MKLVLPAGSTSVICHVFIPDSTSTAGAGKTALVFGDITAYYVRAGGALTALTMVDQTTLGTWDADATDNKLAFKLLHDTNAPGLYELSLPNNILAAGTTSVVIQLRATGAAPTMIEIQLAGVDVAQVSNDSGAADALEDFFDDATSVTNLKAMFDGTGYAGGTARLKVDVDTIKTQAVTCGAGVTIRADVGAAAAPGAANGMLIGGSNAATTFATLTSTGAFTCGSTVLGNTTMGTLTQTGAVSWGATTYASVAITGAFSVGTTTTLTGAVSCGSTFDVVGALSANSLLIDTTTTLTGAMATGAITAASVTSTGALTVSDGVIITASTGNRSAISATGNGSGHGIAATGGATGNGMKLLGGATSGAGFDIRSQGGTGAANYAMYVLGGGSSDSGGIWCGATTDGDGLECKATGTDRHGLYVVGAGGGEGLHATGGSGNTGHGALFEAGSGATNGCGFVCTGVGTGTSHGALFTRGSAAGDDMKFTNGDVTIGTVTTLTNLPAITTGWLTATGIAADAITADKIAAGAIDAATFAADVDAEVRSWLGLATANLDTQIGDIPTNTELATAFATAWSTTTIAEDYHTAAATAATPAELLYTILSCVSQFAISSTTITTYKLDGVTASGTYTMDSATAPTLRDRAT